MDEKLRAVLELLTVGRKEYTSAKLCRKAVKSCKALGLEKKQTALVLITLEYGNVLGGIYDHFESILDDAYPGE